jgi:hypothetical protein
MVQRVELTREQKIAIYMKLPKKELVEMLINCNNIIAQLTGSGKITTEGKLTHGSHRLKLV